MVSTRQSSCNNEGGGSTLDPSNKTRTPPDVETLAHTSQQQHPPEQQIFIVDLPEEVLENIFGYLKFKNISQLRLVSHHMNNICSNILNTAFHRLQNQMLTRFQNIKGRMPRRESARRSHPLACESDIVETLHMRLTLLHMTFGKHIERKHCCFFPGEILDEVNKILLYIATTPKLARPYKVTDELFDLSTMAMEYFKENIEPTLPEISYFGAEFLELTGAACSKYVSLDSPKGDESPPHHSTTTGTSTSDGRTLTRSTAALRRRINRMRLGMRRMHSQLVVTKRELRTLKGEHADQRKQLVEWASRMDDYDKKNDENARKFSTLLQELNKCKTEFQYWRSKSPANPLVCVGCGNVMQHQQHQHPQPLQPPAIELQGLLGADFVPIAGPSREPDCHSHRDGLFEWEDVPQVPEEESLVEPPRAKRKLEGRSNSRDSSESRKSTRGSKGRKRSKL